MPLAGNAITDLGLQLSQQVADETEEERKKRMAALAQQQMLGPAGSMAATSLFGMQAGGRGVGY
jgi:hypothetical protein